MPSWFQFRDITTPAQRSPPRHPLGDSHHHNSFSPRIFFPRIRSKTLGFFRKSNFPHLTKNLSLPKIPEIPTLSETSIFSETYPFTPPNSPLSRWNHLKRALEPLATLARTKQTARKSSGGRSKGTRTVVVASADPANDASEETKVNEASLRIQDGTGNGSSSSNISEIPDHAAHLPSYDQSAASNLASSQPIGRRGRQGSSQSTAERTIKNPFAAEDSDQPTQTQDTVPVDVAAIQPGNQRQQSGQLSTTSLSGQNPEDGTVEEDDDLDIKESDDEEDSNDEGESSRTNYRNHNHHLDQNFRHLRSGKRYMVVSPRVNQGDPLAPALHNVRNAQELPTSGFGGNIRLLLDKINTNVEWTDEQAHHFVANVEALPEIEPGRYSGQSIDLELRKLPIADQNARRIIDNWWKLHKAAERWIIHQDRQLARELEREEQRKADKKKKKDRKKPKRRLPYGLNPNDTSSTWNPQPPAKKAKKKKKKQSAPRPRPSPWPDQPSQPSIRQPPQSQPPQSQPAVADDLDAVYFLFIPSFFYHS